MAEYCVPEITFKNITIHGRTMISWPYPPVTGQKTLPIIHHPFPIKHVSGKISTEIVFEKRYLLKDFAITFNCDRTVLYLGSSKPRIFSILFGFARIPCPAFSGIAGLKGQTNHGETRKSEDRLSHHSGSIFRRGLATP